LTSKCYSGPQRTMSTRQQ